MDCASPSFSPSSPSCQSSPCQLPLLDGDVYRCLSRPSAALLQPLFIENSLCRNLSTTFPSQPFLAAVAEGNLDLVKQMFKIVNRGECVFSREIVAQACICAASQGYLDILKFLVFKVVPETDRFLEVETFQNSALCAAAHGHKNVLKFLFNEMFHLHSALLNGCCVCAANSGQLKTLKFLLNEVFPENGLFLNAPILNACAIVASCNGHVNVVKYLFNKAIPEVSFTLGQEMFSNSLICASANGQLESVQYLLNLASSESYWYLEGNVLNLCCLFANRACQRDVIDALR